MHTQIKTAASGAELLEDLRNSLHCLYLSDLRFAPVKTEAIHRLANTDSGRYSLREWNDAVAYLLPDCAECANAVSAREQFRRAARYGSKRDVG